MDKNFERLLDTLRLVPANGSVSTSDIHSRLLIRGHDVSVRTVQRDLEALAGHYGLVCDDRSKPFGWRWPKGVERLSLPDMDASEALSFQMLSVYLHGLLPASVSHHLQPYVAQAEKKLAADKSAIQRWPGKVSVIAPGAGTIPPPVSRAVHESVSEALLTERMLQIDYRSIGKPLRSHRIHPLGMVLDGGVLYLVAVFDGHSDPRPLALHRMDKATRLDEPSQTPAGFTLQGHIASGGFGCGGDEVIALDATFSNFAGTHLVQAKLAADQVAEEIDSGTVRVKATVRFTQRLQWWLLSFGANVVVHGPPRARRAIAAAHREAAELYAKPTTKSRRAKAPA